MSYRIGIDVGGTFTDFLLTGPDLAAGVYKVLTTPGDPSAGFMAGLAEMALDLDLELSLFLAQVELIVHGTTVTTNAVLTGNGAKTALLTTRGLRDALEMRRGIREEQYNNRYTNVEPLVERRLRRPVTERTDYRGTVLQPLAEEDVVEAVDLFRAEGVQAVAVCFMNSFANAGHEEKAARTLRERLPEAYLTVSSELLPSIRFYDRLSTTALNSYVGPVLERYLRNLTARLTAAGFTGTLLIMQSNGGVVAPEIAASRAALTLLSGPAGGPVAGVAYTAVHDFPGCLTVDMGGTSFDASLVKNGIPLVTSEGEINRLRLALPMLDIVTIGAGGGSIGWIDEGGLLRMGPGSAGADPGPACYGRGLLPTCTDADLVLGYLDPDYFAGGRIRLSGDRAARAIGERVAAPMGLEVVEAAAGMYDLINVNMAAGVREVTVKRGDDPRDFPLVVAGGAGPTHACRIAAELEIPVVVVPGQSSIFCAAGMLMSDLKHDFVRTCPVLLREADPAVLSGLFRAMEEEGLRYLAAEHVGPERVVYRHVLDLRYVKQYHEVGVEVPAADVYAGRLDEIVSRFHARHNELYGYSLENDRTPVEVINLRLTCTGRTEKPRFPTPAYGGPDPSPAYKRHRPVFLRETGAFEDVGVFDGAKLRRGNRIQGPAVIEQVNTSIFVTPEYSLTVDRLGSFILLHRDAGEKWAGRFAL
ncbi:MAG: hydantoinase/oxoprolinase family protein [Peptococcaceae bacterium]|jgi:N-methylhydantoinase A|nr:hydantoinase/oxoprolinase family protein [Peptococcaceae bacterium]